MTIQWMPVPVPAIVPQGPQYTLRKAAVKPQDLADQRIEDFTPNQLAGLPPDFVAELHAQAPTGPGGRAAWTRGITYPPENRIPGAARSQFDYTTLDLPALTAPNGLALTGATGGTLTPTSSYGYQVTAVNANGETTPCTEVQITLGAGKTAAVLTWAFQGNETSFKIYGRVHGALGLIGTVAARVTTFTDTGAPAPGAAPPGTNTTAGPGAYGNAPIAVVIPWVLLAQYGASSFGWSAVDYKERATRMLERVIDFQLEHEFWTGTLAQANGWPNQYLTGITNDLTPGGGAPSVLRGQQLLQDYLEQNGAGGRGMIHCQAQTVPNLLTAQVSPGDETIEDLRGNLIVAGAGYPGTGPGGATPTTGTSWMYATDLVAVRVEDQPTVFPETFAEATDRGQTGQPNTIRFRTMKFGVVYADFQVTAAVNVTLAT